MASRLHEAETVSDFRSFRPTRESRPIRRKIVPTSIQAFAANFRSPATHVLLTLIPVIASGLTL